MGILPRRRAKRGVGANDATTGTAKTTTASSSFGMHRGKIPPAPREDGDTATAPKTTSMPPGRGIEMAEEAAPFVRWWSSSFSFIRSFAEGLISYCTVPQVAGCCPRPPSVMYSSTLLTDRYLLYGYLVGRVGSRVEYLSTQHYSKMSSLCARHVEVGIASGLAQRSLAVCLLFSVSLHHKIERI